MKRHAAEVLSVCDDHFPAAASMMHDTGRSTPVVIVLTEQITE